MKHAKLFTMLVITILLNSGLSRSQDVKPPAPLQNEFFDLMVGNSTGESTINGQTYEQSVSINWDLNHQFLKINLKSVNKKNPSDIYEGVGMYGIDGSGKVKTWWFDVWGAGGVSTGTGNISGMKMQTSEAGQFYHSDNTFEFRDNSMVINRKGSFKTPDGKEIPFEETSTFRRNK